MTHELDTLLDRFEGPVAGDSFEAQRLHLAVRARLLDETVPETRIDRYLVRSRIGVGGMGVVYAAHDRELDREIAIKLVRSTAGSEAAPDQQRLLREARSLAQLSHPNVVAVYDVGLHRGRVFIAMELVRGTTLRAHVAPGITPWRDVVHLYLQAAEGLAAAHAAGLVHRDFKPDNVLVGNDGRVRVVDFGLAQSHGAEASEPTGSSSSRRRSALTPTGRVVGTPAYMAPEQFVGAGADVRTDQFGFCVALWEALFGERPFAGRTSAEVRMAIMLGRIEAPKHPERAPQWLREAVERGLAHDPRARWPSLRHLLDACREPRPWRRWKLALGVVVATLGTGVGTIAVMDAQRRHECASDAEALASTWNDDVAARTRTAFEATGIVHATTSADKLAARLSQWQASWAELSERSCIAAQIDRTLTEAQWQRRDACLQEHGERLGALVEVLAQPDRETVDHALRAAFELPSPRACEDDSALALQATRFGEDVSVEAIARLHRLLARADQLAVTGRPSDARELAVAAHTEALVLGDAALEAESLLVLATSDARLGDYTQAADGAERAYFLATKSGTDELALRAAIDLVELTGIRRGRYDDATVWVRHAEGLLARMGERPWSAADLAESSAALLRAQGDDAGARAAFQRAIDLRTAEAGPDHPAVARVLISLAGMLAERGDAEAGTLLDRAEQIAIRSYGEHASMIAVIEGTRCALEGARNEHAAALSHCARAVELREAELGPEHPLLAISLGNYATTKLVLDDIAGARELLERAVTIRRARLGPQHPSLAISLSNLGVLDHLAGDDIDAEDHLLEALQIRRSTLPADHVDIAVTLCNLGDVYAVRGDLTHARELFDEAARLGDDTETLEDVHGRALAAQGTVDMKLGNHGFALIELEAAARTSYARGGDPEARCGLRFALAQTLHHERGDAQRVRELLGIARSECIAAGTRATELLAALEAWEAAHPETRDTE